MNSDEISKCSRVYLDYLEVELRKSFNEQLIELLFIGADTSLSTKQMLTKALDQIRKLEAQTKCGIAYQKMYEEGEKTGKLSIPYWLVLGERG